jgi:hypothetical protein
MPDSELAILSPDSFATPTVLARPHSWLHDPSPDVAEVLGTAQLAVIAGLPFTALRDAVLSHPKMVEGFNNLFAQF